MLVLELQEEVFINTGEMHWDPRACLLLHHKEMENLESLALYTSHYMSRLTWGHGSIHSVGVDVHHIYDT